MWPEDPAAYADAYSFLPALRRPERHSTAARCRPFPGNDFLEDDTGYQYPNFQVTYLGLKKLLTRIQDPAKAFEFTSYDFAASFPGWPRAGTGKWELRDHYVIDVQPFPGASSKCYAHKVVYVDREVWVTDLTEMYDSDGRFWKMFWTRFAPIQNGDRDPLIIAGGVASSAMLDFKKDHASIAVQREMTMDEQVPHQYQNAQELAFPAALGQVNQ